MGINYKERGQKVANAYALGVCERRKPNLAKMIAEELKDVARTARQEVRKQQREKDT